MEIEILTQVVEIFQKSGVSKLSIKKGDLEICLENSMQLSPHEEEKNMILAFKQKKRYTSNH